MRLEALPPGIKLNLGCGPVQPEGWVNIDASNRAKLASYLPWLDDLLVKVGAIPPTEFGPHTKVVNLFKGLPYSTKSVSCIYAGELWEHFEFPDAESLTKECARVLAPGGVLRVCVPDGVRFWQRYLELHEQEMSKPESERKVGAVRNHVAMYFREICTRPKLFSSMGHTHKWQFDELQLIGLFKSVGLTQVGRKTFHDSRIPDVDSVERSDFLIVEGVKGS